MEVQTLRSKCLGKDLLPKDVLNWISTRNFWKIWVPKEYGGLALDFSSGLQQLKHLAYIDGSLGWTITLCSGANYFIGNLHPPTAHRIFGTQKPVIFGGSGGVFGTAELHSDHVVLNGQWKYATGAPYLTHYTLNASLTKKGLPVLNSSGKPVIQSFIIAKDKIQSINDWNTMGLRATATYSFEVKEVKANLEDSFLYDHFYLADNIFKIPFRIFADLTLWVNYLGMATHYKEEALKYLPATKVNELQKLLKKGEDKTWHYSQKTITLIESQIQIDSDFEQEVHSYFCMLIKKINHALIELHPLLGMKAATNNESINQIFRDYFTATQHRNFAQR